MKRLDITIFVLVSVLLIVSFDLFGQEGTVHSRSFTFQNVTRDYFLYVPAAYTGQKDWPLVINYHGTSGNATEQMNTHSKMNAVADTGHFLIAYPEGLIVQDLAFGGSWTGWHVVGSYSATHDDVAFTDSLIDHVIADYSVDSSRIHATGWSNGGEMSFYLACTLPNRIASVASVSNPMNDFLLNSCQVTRPFSTLLIHGTADYFFPWSLSSGFFSPPPRTLKFWTSQNKCSSDSIVTELPDLVTTDNSTVTLIEYVNCDAGTEVLLYRVNNGGHGWPGSGFTYHPTVLNTNMDISASSEIWNFFKRNPHPNPVDGIAEVDDNVAKSFQLFQNYPNPFNPTTAIGYQLSAVSDVELSIYNLTGQKVATLVSERKNAGHHKIEWDASGFASGVYYYRLEAGEFVDVKKMILLR